MLEKCCFDASYNLFRKNKNFISKIVLFKACKPNIKYANVSNDLKLKVVSWFCVFQHFTLISPSIKSPTKFK